jgi:hypothetical protein
MSQPETPPEIDYLAKDFAGFRQLLLDHLSMWMPDWSEEHPADLGQVLVDVLAYAADYLSYYQDAVATEAYLGTARLRRSVKRHVRMLDYAWHEGCNARVWVQVLVDGDEEIRLPAGTQLFARMDDVGASPVIAPDSTAYTEALSRAPAIFETMLDARLFGTHSEIPFSAKPDLEAGARQAWLDKGATCALLRDPGARAALQEGQVLIFEEIRNPATGRKEGADPGHRHAVRLTQVSRRSEQEIEIEWGADDAMPFDLCLAVSYDGLNIIDTSAARGNIVLADHGRTIRNEELPGRPSAGRYYPHLRRPGLTFSEPFHIENTGIWSAKEMLSQEPDQALPSVTLYELGLRPLKGNERVLLPLVEYQGAAYPVKPWIVRSELMSSGSYERDFAVEIEDDGLAYLRFGFRGSGWEPQVVGAPFLATYRIGNGSAGNVGHETIAHIVTAEPSITGVRNPMRAKGGADPVSTESARRAAPQAYRSIKPCVTPADYAEAAQRHPHVARAVARSRWTGGRSSIFLYVQRLGDRALDERFRARLADFLESYRVAGIDLEILDAQFVPIELALDIQVLPGHQTSIVRAALQQVFSDREDGFFYADRWTFGQAVYQSQVIARAMAVPGVAQVVVEKFRRQGADQDEDPISVGPLEIIRLRCDPRDPLLVTLKFEQR